MNVGQLIALLSQYDPAMPVIAQTEDDFEGSATWTAITSVGDAEDEDRNPIVVLS